MRRVLSFLDLDGDFTFERIGAVKNAAPKPEPMDPDTRALLEDVYRDSNRKLFERLGWPSDHW
jgi:hypothetical protein